MDVETFERLLNQFPTIRSAHEDAITIKTTSSSIEDAPTAPQTTTSKPTSVVDTKSSSATTSSSSSSSSIATTLASDTTEKKSEIESHSQSESKPLPEAEKEQEIDISNGFWVALDSLLRQHLSADDADAVYNIYRKDYVKSLGSVSLDEAQLLIKQANLVTSSYATST